MRNFFYSGRVDALVGLIPNLQRYSPSNTQDCIDYLRGYKSVAKSEKPTRKEIAGRLESTSIQIRK